MSVTATAAARACGVAFASALTELYGFCESTTLSDACVWAEGSIASVAAATATALAAAVGEVTTCGCEIEGFFTSATAVEVGIAAALSSVQEDICIFGAPPLLSMLRETC